jgi:WhiB family redox-sensing transcriptional regulator
MSDWDTTRALLTGIPDLRGASCKRKSGLFERTAGEHHKAGRLTKTELDDARREALRLCASCCAALECRAWLDALPVSRRPTGVVAGLVITTSGTPSKIATPATLGVSGAES